MLVLQQFQQSLQIREVQLPLYISCGGGHQVAVIESFSRSTDRSQKIIQVRLLLRQAESQPLGENLMMAVAQSPVRILRSQHSEQHVMAVSPGGSVPERCQVDEAAKYGRHLR